jgi:HAD superfamily hydrolase (TIGR01457 family)
MTHRLLSTRCFLLDMDGTFYLGEKLLPGALEFIQLLDQRGIGYLFLTNNSSRSRHDYVRKLNRFGLDLPEEKIFTSGEATTIYLQAQRPNARIYLVGTPALEQEFIDQGFVLTPDKPDYAVLGFDTTLTYAKLWKLCDLLTTKIPYIATHPDINCPTEAGYMPDIGSFIELVAASTGRRPDVIIGKPNLPLVAALAAKLGLPVHELCMVGDRLYTDIALGKTGCATVLVLSGESRLEDISGSPFQPDVIAANLADLCEKLISLDATN